MVVFDQLRYMTTRPLKYQDVLYPAGVLLPDGGDFYALRHMENVGLIEKVMPRREAPQKRGRVEQPTDGRDVVGFRPDGTPVYADEGA